MQNGVILLFQEYILSLTNASYSNYIGNVMKSYFVSSVAAANFGIKSNSNNARSNVKFIADCTRRKSQ